MKNKQFSLDLIKNQNISYFKNKLNGKANYQNLLTSSVENFLNKTNINRVMSNIEHLRRKGSFFRPVLSLCMIN